VSGEEAGVYGSTKPKRWAFSDSHSAAGLPREPRDEAGEKMGGPNWGWEGAPRAGERVGDSPSPPPARCRGEAPPLVGPRPESRANVKLQALGRCCFNK